MRIIVFLLISFNLFANDLLQIYIKDGIKAVEDRLEAGLNDANFWQEQLKDYDLTYGYYSKDAMITVVDKDEQKLTLYELKNHKLNQKFEQKVITGLMGNKNKEGDLKTPVGFYEVVNKMVPSDTYYGPWAFVLSYPNLYDKVRGKTGHGIWIHGFPLEGDVRYDAYKTKGCVVMTNDVLLDYEAIISEKQGFVLINEKNIATTNATEISQLLASLFDWKNAWANNDVEKYLSYYNEDFIKYDGTKLANFKAQKRAIFSKNQEKTIRFSDININPYPNIEGKKIFRISFYENYKTATYSFNGVKTLYVELIDNKMSILTEQ